MNEGSECVKDEGFIHDLDKKNKCMHFKSTKNDEMGKPYAMPYYLAQTGTERGEREKGH